MPPEASDQGRRFIVITTINAPTLAIRLIADIEDWDLVVVGDTKTPASWSWPKTTFFSIESQMTAFPSFAAACPLAHYARKNIGYLYAMAAGATVIAETDDDNVPYTSFPGDGDRIVRGRLVPARGWENVYKYFTDEPVWPRGFPLENVRASFEDVALVGEPVAVDCAIHQYLADGDPDVDAIYRLTVGREHTFRGEPVILEGPALCPFNSQNTVWWADVFPLLYLPAYASFRMTDIWRSFVAQVCLHAMEKRVAFRASTVYQDRNQHSLLEDFRSEVPGYLNNSEIVNRLEGVPLSPSPDDVTANLQRCYESLVESGFIPGAELPLLASWIEALPPGYRR